MSENKKIIELKDKELIRNYLNSATHNEIEFIKALEKVVHANGYALISKVAELGPATLYKSLKLNAKCRFKTIYKVLKVLGFDFELVVRK